MKLMSKIRSMPLQQYRVSLEAAPPKHEVIFSRFKYRVLLAFMKIVHIANDERTFIATKCQSELTCMRRKTVHDPNCPYCSRAIEVASTIWNFIQFLTRLKALPIFFLIVTYSCTCDTCRYHIRTL